MYIGLSKFVEGPIQIDIEPDEERCFKVFIGNDIFTFSVEEFDELITKGEQALHEYDTHEQKV